MVDDRSSSLVILAAAKLGGGIDAGRIFNGSADTRCSDAAIGSTVVCLAQASLNRSSRFGRCWGSIVPQDLTLTLYSKV